MFTQRSAQPALQCRVYVHEPLQKTIARNSAYAVTLLQCTAKKKQTKALSALPLDWIFSFLGFFIVPLPAVTTVCWPTVVTVGQMDGPTKGAEAVSLGRRPGRLIKIGSVEAMPLWRAPIARRASRQRLRPRSWCWLNKYLALILPFVVYLSLFLLSLRD